MNREFSASSENAPTPKCLCVVSLVNKGCEDEIGYTIEDDTQEGIRVSVP